MQFPISIIIPVHNEENRLDKCLDILLGYCQEQNWDFEIIVVEDGSKDKSVNIVNQYSLKDNRIILLSLPKRLGKGGSLLKAIECCNKPNISYMDVDLSADPSELTKLIPFIDTFDIVIGSRILRGDLDKIQRPLHRSILSFCYLIFFKSLFKINIQDLQCGFKLFKKDSVKIFTSYMETNGFAFDTEFLIMGSLCDLKIKEVPINWHHDYNSKVNIFKTIISMTNDLLKIWFKSLKFQTNVNTMDKINYIVRPVILTRILSRSKSYKSPKKLSAVPVKNIIMQKVKNGQLF